MRLMRLPAPPPRKAGPYLRHGVARDLHHRGRDLLRALLQAAVFPHKAAHVHGVQEHVLPVLRWRQADPSHHGLGQSSSQGPPHSRPDSPSPGWKAQQAQPPRVSCCYLPLLREPDHFSETSSGTQPCPSGRLTLVKVVTRRAGQVCDAWFGDGFLLAGFGTNGPFSKIVFC